MILALNTCFEGYTPVKVLEESTLYREVYLANDSLGNEVVLTVYDMNRLPEVFCKGKILELDIVPNFTNEALPKFEKSGHYNDDSVSLRWMTTRYCEHTTLTDFILSDNVRNEREMLLQFNSILGAVKELSILIGEGCHNNITTDNIIVTIGKNREIKLHLRGLSCMSECCRGKASFDTNVLSSSFIAPETLLGHYNMKTDIFSLGIVLAFIIQGKHPWGHLIGTDCLISKTAVIRHIRKNMPSLELPDPLKGIVSKAIALKPSERYKSFDEFQDAISGYLGLDRQNEFNKNSAMSTSRSQYEKEDESTEEHTYQMPPQPKSNVKIERVEGNGFNDVAGMDQLKSKLSRNFVDILENRELALQFQITPPNGILLWGPPGTGKTYISRKLAEQSGLMYCLIKPSDLGNIYVHGSQSMIADLFTRSEQLAAKNNCGVLLVFDEFDSLVPRRGVNDNNNQANEVAEFLTRLNDCAEKNVFVVATTNRIDAIDPAVIRKGRMDEVIYVGLPDTDARKELFEIELCKRPHEEIDIERVVKLTNGYSSSDISYIVKECARCSFDESVKQKQMVKISQIMLEQTIAETRPSVTSEELRQFEQTKDSFTKGHPQERPRIGFK